MQNKQGASGLDIAPNLHQATFRNLCLVQFNNHSEHLIVSSWKVSRKKTTKTGSPCFYRND